MSDNVLLNQEDDFSLITKTIAGNRAAFDILVQRNEMLVKKLATKLLKDVELVEDVMQETFLKAYVALNKFRAEANFSTWLYTITLNTSYRLLNELKKEALFFIYPSVDSAAELIPQPVAINSDTPEQLLQVKQTLSLLDKTLNVLPEGFRQAFELREISGLSYAEIAKTMQCSINTVKTRIFRTREALRREITERYARAVDN